MNFNKKYLYFVIFFNSTVIVFMTIYLLLSNNWSIVKPKRTIESNDFKTIPDLNRVNDCERFNGKINVGLFKSILLLNHGYGCRQEIVSSNYFNVMRY